MRQETSLRAAPEAGSSFGPAFLLLNRKQRAALSAVYGYARAADDIADDPSISAEKKGELLSVWRADIEEIYAGGRPSSAAIPLAGAIRDFAISKAPLLLILEGVSQDIFPRKYATQRELEEYMYKVASAVGLVCLEIFGYRDPGASDYARYLGYAVQMTNILRDIREDAETGRVYIPQEDMTEFGVSEEDLKDSKYPENLIKLMKFEAGKAKTFYRKAMESVNPALKRYLLSAFAMHALYAALLEKIERSSYRVKDGRVRLSLAEKLKALLTTWRLYAQI